MRCGLVGSAISLCWPRGGRAIHTQETAREPSPTPPHTPPCFVGKEVIFADDPGPPRAVGPQSRGRRWPREACCYAAMLALANALVASRQVLSHAIECTHPARTPAALLNPGRPVGRTAGSTRSCAPRPRPPRPAPPPAAAPASPPAERRCVACGLRRACAWACTEMRPPARAFLVSLGLVRRFRVGVRQYVRTYRLDAWAAARPAPPAPSLRVRVRFHTGAQRSAVRVRARAPLYAHTAGCAARRSTALPQNM